MPVYAVIDVGTNSVKFHVAERLADGSWRTLVDRAEVTRLGEGIAETGDIAPEAIARTVEAIAGMADEAQAHRAAALVAVGTMGMRSASNSEEFIAQVRERSGVTIEVIPGEEEGRLAYLAARAGLGLTEGSVVVFDTGGGSTQFTFGRGAEVDEQFSLNIGAVRLTTQFGLGGPDHPGTAGRGAGGHRRRVRPPRRRAVPGRPRRHGRRDHQHDRGDARPGAVRPGRRAGLGAQPRRGRSPDRALPDLRRGGSAGGSSGCSPSART